MASNPLKPGTQRPVTNVLVATTAMLSFISLWRAAAIVLNDLGSSAFYAGAIAEQAIGQSAPWFILAVMLFAACVLLLYIESCSMFVRGGVYRVVKEAMGGTLAKVSVSALMFDYILTGPISGVSAGQYLVGFLNDAFRSAHVHIVLTPNATSAAFAVVVTLYFWWQNIKGVPESAEKALRIMYITTVMVVLMLIWAGYTLWIRGFHLPPTPVPSHLEFAPQVLGWLRWSRLPYTFGFIGILIGLGHSVLAMSGEETLAQVYREIEHPKLKNLKKAGVVIVLYSVIFTAGVSFLASMIIPNKIRPEFFSNLISGLAMNFAGPYHLRLVFQAFVVLVGILMLSGAVNTAIVGSNGVLSRVSEDGILPEWFRHPHPRFGTSHRIVNLVALLQVATIILSRGNIFVLGEAYAFGVMWSFSMKGLAVLVLRFTEPEAREFKVPLNFKIGKTEIPLGLALITATLFSLSIINLFTKQVATISGVSFTIALFVVFTISERYYHRRDASAGAELDQFNLAQENDLTPKNVGVRPGNILVPVSNYYALYHLHSALQRLKTTEQDVVVLHIRLLRRAASGEYGLRPDQLFSTIEQLLFTKVLAIAEKEGKSVRLAVAAANDVWDGIMRTAANLQSSSIVVGSSSKMPVSAQAREIGLAWERLPEPRPRLNLDIFTPGGQEQIFYLGPHSPHLTPKEIDLLHNIWLQLSSELSGEELHHHDIVHFALTELEREISEGQDGQVLERLRQHLREIKDRRPTVP
ncbi:MAG TPA: APC family permease [Candidatus Acidoferrales bacterium]|nr:APC family permease [Candidatus Acidoferrales bacterium]